MLKEILHKNIVKDLKVIRRLTTLITPYTIDYRPDDHLRSIQEVLQYLSSCSTNIIRFWYSKNQSDPRGFLTQLRKKDPIVTLENAISIFDAQIVLVDELFANITEDDIQNKEVVYPWGGKGTLGEGIIETSIKWLAAYKMQLFITIKIASGKDLKTPDLWHKTEIEA